MSGFKFLYWDDYETPKGEQAGEASGTAHPPEDDTEESRSA